MNTDNSNTSPRDEQVATPGIPALPLSTAFGDREGRACVWRIDNEGTASTARKQVPLSITAGKWRGVRGEVIRRKPDNENS